MKTKINSRKFSRDMNNIIKYSEGFLEGAQKGKGVLLEKIGINTVELLKQYVDANARINPDLLHHIYEWSMTGSPGSRLFDIHYTISNIGLSFKSQLRQSTSIKSGSNVPFYDKARIMEEGIAVTIRPVRAKALAFEKDGEMIYTKGPVTVENPGGNTKGQFQKVVDEFFLVYFTQAFILESGMFQHLKNPVLYKQNFAAGKTQGKTKGVATGFKWVTNIDRIV